MHQEAVPSHEQQAIHNLAIKSSAGSDCLPHLAAIPLIQQKEVCQCSEVNERK
jgi:hypothetical protein